MNDFSHLKAKSWGFQLCFAKIAFELHLKLGGFIQINTTGDFSTSVERGSKWLDPADSTAGKPFFFRCLNLFADNSVRVYSAVHSHLHTLISSYSLYPRAWSTFILPCFVLVLWPSDFTQDNPCDHRFRTTLRSLGGSQLIHSQRKWLP